MQARDRSEARYTDASRAARKRFEASLKPTDEIADDLREIINAGPIDEIDT